VRQMFTRFHAGDSLRGIVAWLTAQGMPTRSGRAWSPSSVRTILTNPRYAGRVVYRGQYPGEINGKMGAWPPLVEEWLFDAVQAKLSDPRRRKQIGTHRKHLGSGLYLCGVCDQPVRSHTSSRPEGQQLRYRCPGGRQAAAGHHGTPWSARLTPMPRMMFVWRWALLWLETLLKASLAS